MLKLISLIVVVAAYVLMTRLVQRLVETLAETKAVNNFRKKYIARTLHLGLLVVFLMALVMVLGIEYAQVGVLLSSIFAVVGIALFAQWSILSNITASLIIFFGFPYRVGDFIRIADKDYEIYGEIDEIAPFHVIIRQGNSQITYPNSLILQKAVIKYPSLEAIKQEIEQKEAAAKVAGSKVTTGGFAESKAGAGEDART